MENVQNDFIASQKRKKRLKRIRSIVALCVAALLLCAGGVLLYRYAHAEDENVSVLTWRATAVSEGEIKSVISGSGTLSARTAESFTAPALSTVEAVHFQTGDAVSKGDVILTLSSDTVADELDALYDELETLRADMAGITQTRSSLSVTATAKGVVKDIRAAAGDLAENAEYLCILSTDGRMKLVFDAPDTVHKYDAVLVSVEGEQYEGIVREVESGKATVIIDKNSFSIGTSAEVTDENGTPLGAGTLDVNEYVQITARAGRIATIAVKENQIVSKGKTLFTLAKGAPTDDYLDAKEQEAELLDQIAEMTDSTAIRAGFDGLLTTLSVSAGDEVAEGGALCTLSGTDGLTMTLAIDELDIASVRHGQNATITLDALEGEYGGTVSNISYAGSGSYVTSYTATVAVDPIEGAYPGMSASVEIITDTSGTSMIVSASALQYDGEQAFLYRAGADAARGDTVAESALALDTLERVSVETGMADGSYVVVVSDALNVGDLIWTPERTTTASYSDSESTTTFSMGGMGGTMPAGEFGGGSMPDGSGRRTGEGGFGSARPAS